MNEIVLTDKAKNIFESLKKVDENDHEYWLARELMPHFDYTEWRNFLKVINKARTALKHSYPHPEYHFVELTKKIKIGAGTNKAATREVLDYKLTRHACYLIAQNGDFLYSSPQIY